ncbi:MAG TPA: hypothetical protein VIK04_21140 [Solirubrobacteraceae bacterium]
MFAELGEREMHRAGMRAIGFAPDKAGRLSAVNQADGAVVAQDKVVGDLANRRSEGIAVASHGEEQLVLRGGQAARSGLLLAPMQEAPETRTKLQEPLVVVVGKLVSPTHIAKRYRKSMAMLDAWMLGDLTGSDELVQAIRGAVESKAEPAAER